MTESAYPVNGEVADAADVKQFTFLSTFLTSTSFDGDAFSTTAKTLIDLSAVFSGTPAGIKGVIIKYFIRDSGSAANECWLILGDTDFYARGQLTVPCNSDGDIYYQIQASGASTFDLWLSVGGYLQGG
jgi:hypothetical protein